MRSQRQLRVGEEIRHALASVFMRDEVPWPQGFGAPVVTVTEVQISPDLKNGTVFVMPLGGLKLDETVRILNDLAGFFRHAIAQSVDMRYTPKLNFKADNSFVYAQRIDEILHDPEVAKDLEDDVDD
ncbi:MAG TPA: 30S ribosome-binding factor RbfA [Alphaproteobacteria bacterium]|nr:30S ribosome-binding factor RbfA [Alphaproteobacteria bacterium]